MDKLIITEAIDKMQDALTLFQAQILNTTEVQMPDATEVREKPLHITKEDLHDVIIKLAKSKGAHIVREVFEEYKASNLSDLSPRQYQAVYSVCSQALN